MSNLDEILNKKYTLEMTAEDLALTNLGFILLRGLYYSGSREVLNHIIDLADTSSHELISHSAMVMFAKPGFLERLSQLSEAIVCCAAADDLQKALDEETTD